MRALSLAAVLVACTPSAPPVRTPGPGRIASLAPAVTEVLYALGCGPQIVLRDTASTTPAEARRLPAIDPFRLPLEHLAGYRPKLVLLSSHADAAKLAALRRLGIVARSFDAHTVEATLASIITIGELCGRREQALTLVGQMRARIERVRRRVSTRRPPAVYVEVDSGDALRPWAAGPGSLLADMLGHAAGRNVLLHLGRPYAQVAVDTIATLRPEVILLAGPTVARRQARESLWSRPGWRSLRNSARVLSDIDDALIARPGPRLALGLEMLARALHPDS